MSYVKGTSRLLNLSIILCIILNYICTLKSGILIGLIIECYFLYILQAKKFYESALRLEPGFLGAALALAELHVMEGRNGDAVSLLQRYLKDWADDSLHVKLAQVFAATNMLQDALSHYQAALR